jgi:hypothetical protein
MHVKVCQKEIIQTVLSVIRIATIFCQVFVSYISKSIHFSDSFWKAKHDVLRFIMLHDFIVFMIGFLNIICFKHFVPPDIRNVPISPDAPYFDKPRVFAFPQQMVKIFMTFILTDSSVAYSSHSKVILK